MHGWRKTWFVVYLFSQWVWTEARNPANLKLLRAALVFSGAVLVFRSVKCRVVFAATVQSMGRHHQITVRTQLLCCHCLHYWTIYCTYFTIGGLALAMHAWSLSLSRAIAWPLKQIAGRMHALSRYLCLIQYYFGVLISRYLLSGWICLSTWSVILRNFGEALFAA